MTFETLQRLCDASGLEISPLRSSGASNTSAGRVVSVSSPIHAANPQTVQQSILSMEDDEISDQEVVSGKSFRV